MAVILGIDPGLANLGWAVLATRNGWRPDWIAGGVLRTKGLPKPKREAEGISKSEDKLRRACEITGHVIMLLREYAVDVIGHEVVSLGFHQPTTLFDMGLAFGAIAGAAASVRVPLVGVPTRDVKCVLTGDRKAEKAAVIEAVRGQYPTIAWPRATLVHEHLADAASAAVAIRHHPAVRSLTGEGPIVPLGKVPAVWPYSALARETMQLAGVKP